MKKTKLITIGIGIWAFGAVDALIVLNTLDMNQRNAITGIRDAFSRQWNKNAQDVDVPDTPVVIPVVEDKPPVTPKKPSPAGVLPPLDPNEEEPFLDDFHLGGSDIEKLKRLPMLITDAQFDALIKVESSGDDFCIGDAGNAYGPLQIWECYVRDVNEKYGTSFTAQQMLGNRELSKLVTNAYMNRYKNYVPLSNFEAIARVHNGGCNVYKKKGTHEWDKTTAYWNKVQKAL